MIKDEDLSQYVFSKFAATYFQSASHTHVKQNLRQPLLPLASEADTMVSITKVLIRIFLDLLQIGSLTTLGARSPSAASIYCIVREQGFSKTILV